MGKTTTQKVKALKQRFALIENELKIAKQQLEHILPVDAVVMGLGVEGKREFYKLRNIRMAGNEHGRLEADVIYAELVEVVEGKNILVISATLEHILSVIRQRNLMVEGISVNKHLDAGSLILCSEIRLDLYRG